MSYPIDEKLDRILSELAGLRNEVRSLTATKAAKEDTADEMVRAQRERYQRHQNPCETCGGPGVILTDDGAGACPVCNSDGGTALAPVAPMLVADNGERVAPPPNLRELVQEAKEIDL